MFPPLWSGSLILEYRNLKDHFPPSHCLFYCIDGIMDGLDCDPYSGEGILCDCFKLSYKLRLKEKKNSHLFFETCEYTQCSVLLRAVLQGGRDIARRISV